MASTDSPKRKAEEATPAAPAAEGEKKAETTASGSAAGAAGNGEPDAKKLKTSATPDLKAVRKQVEYYMSDDNLKGDKFFHEKISEQGEGWLDMGLILQCKKMKMLRASREDVLEALKESKLEVKDGGAFVRRPGNAALPTLEAKSMPQKKSSLHAHDGGAMIIFKGIPAEQSWQQVKEKLKATLPTNVNLWFVSEVDDKGQCFVSVSPFEGDVETFEKLSLEVGGTTLKSELCHGDALQAALKMLPKHVREKREKATRQRQKERNRPIILGSQKFVNVAALRTRIKEIINARSNGEQLKTDGSDFKLVKSLLEFHPKGEEKSKGLIGIKVAESSQGGNRCFFMLKEGGAEEDFSAMKCLAAIEANPPYEKKAEPAAKPAEAAKSEDKPADESSAATTEKPAEKAA